MVLHGAVGLSSNRTSCQAHNAASCSYCRSVTAGSPASTWQAQYHCASGDTFHTALLQVPDLLQAETRQRHVVSPGMSRPSLYTMRSMSWPVHNGRSGSAQLMLDWASS